MSFAYSMRIKNARLQAVIDGIGPGASLQIGERPGMNDVLASLRLQSPAFYSPSDGQMQLAGAPLFGRAIATGKAAAARIVDAAGEVQVYDLTVGLEGSGAHLEMGTTDIRPGIDVAIQSGAIVHA
jgi:hypothetical protein